MAKYIFVTGGVVSSLGKGIAAASIGCLLESRGLRVSLQKFDPYLNVDPGHHEPVPARRGFRYRRGAETDLDLGHYERFTHAKLTQSNNLTSRPDLRADHPRERRGDTGKTVQVIPHVTNEIKAAARKVAADVDVVIVEVGGTVGDIESLPFLEAIRQLRHEMGRDNTAFVHVTLVPWIAAAQELKTKPTQHSVKELRALGIQPDMLLCRSERVLPHDMKEKIALFCDVDVEAVITASDVHSVYEVPLVFAEQGVDEIILRILRMEAKQRDLSRWTGMLERMQNPEDQVDIALIGKYVEYEDSYKSLKEALLHGAWRTGQGEHPLDRIRQLRWPELRERVGTIRRDSGSWRIWKARRGRHDFRDSIRARKQGAIFRNLPGNANHGDRVRAACLRAGACQFHRVRSGHAGSCDLQIARVERRGRTGRNHAPGSVSLPVVRRKLRAPGLWSSRDQRAASPSLRIQPGLRASFDIRRIADRGPDARFGLRRNLRDPGSSLVSRLPVPSGI